MIKLYQDGCFLYSKFSIYYADVRRLCRLDENCGSELLKNHEDIMGSGTALVLASEEFLV